MPSITLSNAGDKTTIKKQLPSSSNKILTATVVRLYQAHPDPRSWSYANIIGAIALVQDKSRGHQFFFRIVDLQDNRGILWEHQLSTNFIYKNDTPFFHTFGTKDHVVGLSFADENEAATFYKKVLGREKSAKKPKKSAAVESDKSKSFFGSSNKSKPKGKIDKSLIGKPMDFKHLGHIGYDSNVGFSAHHEDPEWQKLFSQLGVDGSAQEQAFSDTQTMQSLVSFVQKNGGIKQVNQNLQSGKLSGLQPQSSQPPPPKQKRPPPPPPPTGSKPRRGPPPPPNRASPSSSPAPGPTSHQSSPASPAPAPPRAVPTPPSSKPPPLPSSQRPALPGQKPPLPSSRPPPLPSTQRPALPGQKPPPAPQRPSPVINTPPPVVAATPPPPAASMPPPSTSAPPPPPPPPPVTGAPPPPPPPPPSTGAPPPPPPPPTSGVPPPPPPPPTSGAPPPPAAGGVPPPSLPPVTDERSGLLKSIQAGTTLRKVGAPEARTRAASPPQPPASSGDGNLASALMSILENRRNDLESDEDDEDDDWDD